MSPLLSDDWGVVARALKDVILRHRSSSDLQYAAKARDYYEYKHDILKNRIFYFNDAGQLVEDKYASNVKIPHGFFHEQVDQKVQYLLSNPVEIEAEDNDLKNYLDEYWDEATQLFLQEVFEGASINGKEFAYSLTRPDDRLGFQVSSALSTIFIRNEDTSSVERVIYFYDEEVKDESGKTKTITYVQVFTDQLVVFFKSNKESNFALDVDQGINPRQHVIATDAQGNTLARSYGSIPFYKLANNRQEMSDLKPIKELIDDYDIMACYLSNNLQDFSDAIYVVTGYDGEDTDRLRQNIKNRKVVNAGSGTDAGDVQIRTVSIPIEARKAKLDIDKEAIYKFGMAFDSSQVGDGNITNVVIKSRYALLNMKVNKAEVRLRALIKWMNERIVADINRRYGKDYKVADITVTIIRESVVDTKEIADIELIEAQTKEALIQAILAVASYLDEESTLRLICEQFELEYDEVIKRLEDQDNKTDIVTGTDPVILPEGVGANGTAN